MTMQHLIEDSQVFQLNCDRKHLAIAVDLREPAMIYLMNLFLGHPVRLQNLFDLRSLQCEWGIGLFLWVFYSFKIHFLPVKWMEISNSLFMAENFL